MTSHLALLRGVNVSGKNALRMADLRDSMARLGFEGVQTYLQSGNIVFRTATSDTAQLANTIQSSIAQDFGLEVPVLVLSAQELDGIANANPLWPDSGGEESLLHCTFLFRPVSTVAFQTLKLPVAEGERAVLVEQAVFLHCPHGYGKTKLNNSYFERVLGGPATTRNWRTVLALQGICSAPFAWIDTLSSAII